MKQQTQLTILQLNDTHAYLEPQREVFLEGGAEGCRQAGGFVLQF